MFRRSLLSFLTLASCAWGADVRNELPAPNNLQAVVLKKTITLSWQWTRPEELPIFKEFGFEVKRSDGKTHIVPGATYADADLAPGSYSYTVRVHGLSKEKGKRITYISDWSEPAAGTINTSCPQSPTIELTVEPTQKSFSSIPSLRFHLKGKVTVEPGCTLEGAHYHLDTGTGINHTGEVPVDAQGRFNTFVDAIGPDDEVPAGKVSFGVTVTAKDEVGPITSDVYTLDVELRNPFAPTKP
jgi:hypothetical protein